MLKIYTHTPSARFAYISKFLLETVLGIDFKHISHLSEFDPAQDQLLNYSNQRSSFNELYLAPHGLLSETDIRDLDIEVKNDQSLPYFFSSNNSDWHFDIFSAAFYLLSRYEEYLPNQADTHGRFAAENSLAYRAGFLQQPLIDEWAFAFASELKKVFPTLVFRENHFQVACTIDIDQAFRTKGKSNARFIKSILGSLLKADFKDLKNKIAVRRLQIEDPFDQYERLEKIHRKINWKAIYFILFAEKNTAQDINLAITQADFLQRIKRLSHTADIGIHPSYQSNKNPEIMQSERFNLSQVIQKNINSSRQHYLKMQIPNTYYDLIKIGILHDYTMGYASQIGFRASTCRPFPFFDLQANEITFLTLHPFCLMDTTFHAYLKYTPEQTLAAAKKLLASVQAVNGVFCTLWHNESMSGYQEWKGWENIYEELLSSIYV
jgi:hypothetical protein